MNIDLMSISGHKCYGPKGVGALYIRRKPRVRLEPLMSGGGQERGYRSGTLPTPLVVVSVGACVERRVWAARRRSASRRWRRTTRASSRWRTSSSTAS